MNIVRSHQASTILRVEPTPRAIIIPASVNKSSVFMGLFVFVAQAMAFGFVVNLVAVSTSYS
jgi:hypothetical protein